MSPALAASYSARMITPEQGRAARAMLGWNQRRLAAEANVPLSAVKAWESGRDIRVSVLAAIERTLIAAGILFLEPGDVRNGGRGLRFRQRP
jgi:transcriptional regulator with XRE-family HTH domain